MLEALVASSLVVVVLLASVQVVTRTVAQIGYARTPQAERAARAKSAALHWLQGELDYLRSRGYGYLTSAYLNPSGGWTSVDGGAAVERTIRPGSKEPGESALPRGFARAVVRVEVEAVEGCPDACVISIMRARVRLYRGENDSDPFVEGATSVVRR
jgi:hypothetical protein